jgi:hypothetical protein
MATQIGTQSTLGDMLNSLIELNHDNISAFDAALKRIEREDFRIRLRAMGGDMRRQIDEIKPHVQARTTNVSNNPSPKEVLTKGRVLLASLIGDQTILKALHTMQQDMQEAYSRAVAYEHDSPDVKQLLQNHLTKQREHTTWLAKQSTSPDAPQNEDEIDATMKTRTVARTDAANSTLKHSTDV